MQCKLHFTVRAFAEVSFFGMDEFEVVLGQILQQRFQSLLFHSQAALVVGVLDERRRRFDTLHIAQQHGVTCFWHLTRALKLMRLKPILLKATLTAIFGWLALTLRTAIKRYVLLLYFKNGFLSTLYLLLYHFFQGTDLVPTVLNVY